MKNTNAIFKPVDGFKKARWYRSPLLVLIIATGLGIGSCRTIYVPSETSTTVTVKDSTVINIKDSIRITEATRYRDMAWLGDTLKIEGQRSRMFAVADTVKEAIIGGLEEDKVEERTKIIYKDRIEYRDSVRVEEKPVPYPVEKEVKIYPKWMVILSILGIVLTGFGLFQLYLKFKQKFKL